MDTNSLMDLDDSSFMSYIEDHIIRNGRDAILKVVALNGGDYDENSNDSHSRDSSDDSSNQTGSDDDDFEKGYDSNEDEVAIGSQRVLGDALPILDSQKIHAPIVHQHIHCPPLDDMSAVFQGFTLSGYMEGLLSKCILYSKTTICESYFHYVGIMIPKWQNVTKMEYILREASTYISFEKRQND